MSSWLVTEDKLAAHRYTLAISVVAATMFALPGTAPSSDPLYALLTLAVIVGMLLTVRLAPNRPDAISSSPTEPETAHASRARRISSGVRPA